MAAADSCPAFSAFEKQLKTLCLKEFPCGTGTWRRTKSFPQTAKKKTLPNRRTKVPISNADKVDSQFVISLKDYGASHEKMETLQEYVGSKFSPWHLDYSWSQEARELREIAVKSPWLIDDNFVMNYFRTLRIVDKQVTEVDPAILKFKNLEELTLSANKIKNISSGNLPESLKVLELCANEISDISALCLNPPDLHHLGLGYNNISFIGDYITGDNWPSLLSLDLSQNNLSDLLDVVRKLGTLPKLRNLILQGNPLSLIPGYRGYTVDSLRRLSVLDDIRISADEKHHYKGLARRREYILDEAKLTLQVSQIKGVPMPEELKNPEEQPEFPVVERRYYIQFQFLEDKAAQAEVLNIRGGSASTAVHPDTAEHSGRVTSQDQHSEEGRRSQEDQRSMVSHQEKSVNFTSQPDLEKVQELAAYNMPSSVMDGCSLNDAPLEGGMPWSEPPVKQIKLGPLNTDRRPWSEEIDLNWSSMQVRDDLHRLRDFLRDGMDLSVMEEVVLCYPLEEEDGDRASVAGSVKKGKDGKGDKKGKADPPKKDDKKKKKKEPEIELRRSPPKVTTLATFHLPLDELLEGEFEVQSTFTQGASDVASTVRTLSPEPGRKDGKKDGKERKGGKSPLGTKKEKEKVKDAGKGGKGKEVEKKDGGKKGKAGATPIVEEDGEEIPPPPLEVHVSVKLHHWETAMDSLKEEEEKNRALQEQA